MVRDESTTPRAERLGRWARARNRPCEPSYRHRGASVSCPRAASRQVEPSAGGVPMPGRRRADGIAMILWYILWPAKALTREPCVNHASSACRGNEGRREPRQSPNATCDDLRDHRPSCSSSTCHPSAGSRFRRSTITTVMGASYARTCLVHIHRVQIGARCTLPRLSGRRTQAA